MCGIVGLLGHEPVNVRIYDALTVLQHRGQDAAAAKLSVQTTIVVARAARRSRKRGKQSDLVAVLESMRLRANAKS